MKKIFLMFLTVILLTGCARKIHQISGDEFTRIMNSHNYELNNVVDYYDYANSALEYRTSKNDFSLFYISGDNNIVIKGVYSDECSNVQRNTAEEVKPIIKKGDNYSTFEFETKDKYYYLAWVEGTMLKTECDIKKKKEMKNLIKELGY